MPLFVVSEGDVSLLCAASLETCRLDPAAAGNDWLLVHATDEAAALAQAVAWDACHHWGPRAAREEHSDELADLAATLPDDQAALIEQILQTIEDNDA